MFKKIINTLFRRSPQEIEQKNNVRRDLADPKKLEEQLKLAEEHLRKGWQLRNEKDFEGALSQFEEVIRIKPDDWTAYDEIAFWLADKLDNPRKGIKYAKKALELVPKDTNHNYIAVLDTTGWCYYKSGDIKSAQEYLEKAVKLQDIFDSFFTLHIYHLLAVYESIENIQGAKELYKKIENSASEDWINAEAEKNAQIIMKRINSLERQKERQKINDLAKAWNSICNTKENIAPSAEIIKILELLQHNREEAKSKLGRYIINYPFDPVVIHCLALLCYWELQAGKQNGDWRAFISYWVMLMYHSDFWDMWKGEREQYYFEKRIEDEKLNNLHKYLWEMIEAKVPNSYNGYLILEKRTAGTMQRLNEWASKYGLNPLKVICGPIMSKTLRIEDRFKTMIKEGNVIFPSNNDFTNLILYFSPLGLATIFMEERDIEMVFRAIDEVKSKEIPESFKTKYVDLVIEVVGRQQTSSEKIGVLRQAIQRIEDANLKSILCKEYEKLSNDSARVENWEQAYSYLALAFEMEPHNNETENSLFICYLNAASIKLKENRHEDAISLIEKAERLRLNAERKKNLSDICSGCAIKFIDTDKPEKAEIMAKKAEKYDSANKEIKQLLDAIKLLKIYGKEVLNFLGQARQAASNNNWSYAIEKYRTALKKAEDKRLGFEAIKNIKSELVDIINAKEVKRVNELFENVKDTIPNKYDYKSSEKIDSLLYTLEHESLYNLREALNLQPSNEVIKKNIQNIEDQIKQIRLIKKSHSMDSWRFNDNDISMRDLMSKLSSLVCPECGGRLSFNTKAGTKVSCQGCSFELKLR